MPNKSDWYYSNFLLLGISMLFLYPVETLDFFILEERGHEDF